MEHINCIQQLAYKDKLYIAGPIRQVTAYLSSLSAKYRTVREYLDHQTAEL